MRTNRRNRWNVRGPIFDQFMVSIIYFAVGDARELQGDPVQMTTFVIRPSVLVYVIRFFEI